MKLQFIIMLTLIALQCDIHAYSKEYNGKELLSLFTTPSQRQSLNAKRLNAKVQPEKPTMVGPTSVHIDGVVSRNDGKSVVWINGKNTMKNSMVDGVKVYSNSMTSSHKIPVMIDGRKVYIKPGDSWSDNSSLEKDDF